MAFFFIYVFLSPPDKTQQTSAGQYEHLSVCNSVVNNRVNFNINTVYILHSRLLQQQNNQGPRQNLKTLLNFCNKSTTLKNKSV